MRKSFLAGVMSLVLILPGFALAQTKYSTDETDLGTILDDEAARKIVDSYIPGLSSGDQIDMARGMTLKDIQMYSPDDITDEVLVKIDADFSKLAVEKE